MIWGILSCFLFRAVLLTFIFLFFLMYLELGVDELPHVHPGRITWNLQITHLERKTIFQTSMIMFHVNLPGCIGNWELEDQGCLNLATLGQLSWLFSEGDLYQPSLEQKPQLGGLLFWDTLPLHRDFFTSHYKDPVINQPVFQGISLVGFDHWSLIVLGFFVAPFWGWWIPSTPKKQPNIWEDIHVPSHMSLSVSMLDFQNVVLFKNSSVTR